MGLIRNLAARAAIPVLPVVCVGGRAAGRSLHRLDGVRVVDHPRAASILLVIGRPTRALLGPLLAVHDQLPTPRATIWWRLGAGGEELIRALGDVVESAPLDTDSLREVFRDLISGTRRSDPPALPDVEPAAWRGVGPYGQGGTGMTGGNPYGRLLPGRAPDPDGLQLDQLELVVGPYFPPLPRGLVLGVGVQGDVVRTATLGDNPQARILVIAAITIGLSVEWFATDARHGEYYALLLLSVLGAIVLAGAADLMAIILGLLLSSATGYVLAAYRRADARSGEAAIKYYLLGALTNGALVYGAVLLFGLGATTTLGGLADALPGTDTTALIAGTALMILGVAFKAGAVPAHAWVPDVADGAPAPVAAFLTVAPKVGALIALIALSRLVAALPEGQVGWRLLVAVLAGATMTLGNLAALWQDDVRRLLGWSAVSQTGYGLMAVVALGRSELAVPSLLFFLVAYAVANLAAFGVVIELRGRADRATYAGLAAAQPLLALVLVLSFLSLVDVPPLAGFTAKLALFGAVIDAGYTWLAVLTVANTVVSLAYYLRVLAPAYFMPPAPPFPVLGSWARGVTILCGAAVLIVGLLAEPLLDSFDVSQLRPG